MPYDIVRTTLEIFCNVYVFTYTLINRLIGLKFKHSVNLDNSKCHLKLEVHRIIDNSTY